MALPLDVFADLQIAVDGEGIDVQADGDRIVVDLSSLEAGRRLLSSYPLSDGRCSGPTERIHDALQIAGLTVEVQLRGDPIARMGAGAQPGRLESLLPFGGIEFRSTRVVRATVRQRPLLAVLVGGLLVVVGWLVIRAVLPEL